MIPLADQSGDISEIGRWVLEQACKDRHRWDLKADDEPFVMAVNISALNSWLPDSSLLWNPL